MKPLLKLRTTYKKEKKKKDWQQNITENTDFCLNQKKKKIVVTAHDRNVND